MDKACGILFFVVVVLFGIATVLFHLSDIKKDRKIEELENENWELRERMNQHANEDETEQKDKECSNNPM